MASRCAQARPAGPAPTTATRLPRRRGAREGVLAALHQMVGGVALQLADLHRLVLGEVADAGLLAERLDRADAGAHAAHDVGLEDGLAGAGRIVGLDLADEERDVDVRRAGLHAGRVEAEIAAVGLDERLVARQRRMQVGEIAGVFVRRQPPGGNVRSALSARRHLVTPNDPASAGSRSNLMCKRLNRVFRAVNFFIKWSIFDRDPFARTAAGCLKYQHGGTPRDPSDRSARASTSCATCSSAV